MIDRTGGILGHGHTALRQLTLDVLDAALAAADPEAAARAQLALDGHRLLCGSLRIDLRPVRRVLLVGAGKASVGIAAAVADILGPRLAGGLVICRHGQGRPIPGVRVLEAGHPIPDAAGQAASRELAALVAGAGPEDLVLAAFTGGSSALLTLPPPGVSPDDKVELNRLLLASGLDIFALNTVRKHVSAVKGGRLAALAAPARLLNLTVSDVAGDAFDFITDPTVPDTTSADDAIDVLRSAGLLERLPNSVRAHLERQEPNPDLSGQSIDTCLLISGDSVARAMLRAAEAAGLQAAILTTFLSGQAREAGRFLAAVGREIWTHGRPLTPPACLVGAGGETTVALEGAEWGAGGPNQELALAGAIELPDGAPIVVAALDSDGSDGSTPYAGALVDGTTAVRAREQGVELRGALASHRSTAALATLGELLDSGQTGTNVNDLFVVLCGEGG